MHCSSWWCFCIMHSFNKCNFPNRFKIWIFRRTSFLVLHILNRHNFTWAQIFGICTEPRNIVILSQKLTVINKCFLQSPYTDQVNIKVTTNEICAKIIKSTPELNHMRVSLLNNACTVCYKNDFRLLPLIGTYLNVFITM